MSPMRGVERDVASGYLNIHMDQPRSINCEDRCNFGIMLIGGQETIRTHVAYDDVSCRRLERDDFLPTILFSLEVNSTTLIHCT